MARAPQTIRIVFIFLCVVLNSVKISAILRKCCPMDSVIKNVNGESILDCVKGGADMNWDWNNLEFAVNNNNNESRLPLCKHEVKQMFQVSTDFDETNGCLDQSNDRRFYTLHCLDEPNIAVHKINKCCPVNHSYDHSERFCVTNTDSNLHHRELFKQNVVIFEPKVPVCDDDEVFVEYYSLAHDIDFIDHNLKITTEHFPAGEILQTNKYCVEGLVNTDDNKNNRHIIVRSCRPRTTCDTIPCMRRCCQSDQMLQRNRTARTVNCVPHPNNTNFMPVFYDIKFPLELNKTQDREHLKGLALNLFSSIFDLLLLSSGKNINICHSLLWRDYIRLIK